MGFAMIGSEMIYEGADLSDAAWRTHAEALVWSRQRLLDLVIPKRDLQRFAYTADPDQAAAELVLSGWWGDEGDHWRVLFGADWQRTREQIEHCRESEKVKKARQRAHARGDHSRCFDPKRCLQGIIPRESPRESRHVSREEKRREEQHLEESHQAGTNRANGCHECQRRAVFGSGLCPDHSEPPPVGAE